MCKVRNTFTLVLYVPYSVH